MDAATTTPAAPGGVQPGELPQPLPAEDLAGRFAAATNLASAAAPPVGIPIVVPAPPASRIGTAAPAVAAAEAHLGVSAQEQRGKVASFPLAAGDVGTSDEEGEGEPALMGSHERGGLQAAAAGATAEEVHGAMLASSIQTAGAAGDAHGEGGSRRLGIAFEHDTPHE